MPHGVSTTFEAAGGHAGLVEAGQLAMRLHAAAGRDRSNPGAVIARPGRARRLRPAGPGTGRCGTALRHAPSRHPADRRGGGNPREIRLPERVALRLMECDLQLQTVGRVPEWEGPSLGNANVTGVRIGVRRPDPVCALRPSLFSGP